ncbi:response regulator [Amphiplicatus metriothermophilus]|uniref:Two component transcriptional regulator, LuxR family n=1 Tax=Amphiplicatus metriothermophilus TaxID=1519374 RepID=A0A239PQS0_9PROT|nr:response regulator transcription factor [Amphiplicatus metriothermophilus]MBB5518445.1 DNA-binding NarL/FixJ family response regulator [Amphiplicatus metriothermophilus]SNT72393.1 two component transcriptional regulator, LuxR family [Amphiplicatus metriothermophilus]
MTESQRILIADDHPLFRLALSEAVRAAAPGCDILQASTLDEAVAIIESRGGVELVLLDLLMPGANGFSGLIYLRVQRPETPVAIVSGVDEPRVVRKALAFGASGYIPKSLAPARISEAIAAILAGACWAPDNAGAEGGEESSETDFGRRLAGLSAQQFNVLRLIAEGKLNKEIAHELNLSISTVKAHTTALLKKLGLQRRTQILAAMQTLDLAEHRRGDGF